MSSGPHFRIELDDDEVTRLTLLLDEAADKIWGVESKVGEVEPRVRGADELSKLIIQRLPGLREANVLMRQLEAMGDTPRASPS